MTNQYRICVKSTPQRLEQVGALVPGWWIPPDDELGRRASGEILLDTGAYGALIDSETAVALQLSPQGTREIHGIHGYGRLHRYFVRLVLPAKDGAGNDCFFEQLLECVGVPSLADKSRENDAQVIGILGRMFLRSARLNIDGGTGTVNLIIQR